jgi:ribosomal protein S18 acetylase RimI-like enzyme
MSMGLESLEGVRSLIAVERARGTRYYAAALDGRTVGAIGVFFDPTGETTELEPPQVIDLAVLPEYRRRGVARALMEATVGEVHASGHGRLWLYTDGNSPALLAFYGRLGFRLVSVVPDLFGDGTAKAILRRDLG